MAREHLFLKELKKLFELRSDMDKPAEIEASILQGVKVHGTNLWILMFAIFVASIGLNVNSTAVIIGAMLISPLMGPIMGIGYGAGVANFTLIRQSFRTLGAFVFLSLLTSSAYFFITPLTEAQSELLARTSPTLWDVSIALFGGMAGIIAVTRQEKGNVIPGVAIATALMPPLCTAGYGIATGQPKFFFGAFYLFTINAVYIALSALLFTRFLRLPRKSFPSESLQKRARFVITAAIILTIVPSVYLAFSLVKHELFKTNANQYIATIARTEQDLFVMQKDIIPEQKEISLTIAGIRLDNALTERLNAQLAEHNLGDARLVLRSLKQDNGIDFNTVKSELQQDIYRNSLQLLENKNSKIQELENVVREHQNDQLRNIERLDGYDKVREELKAQYPELVNVYLAHGRNDGVPSESAHEKDSGQDDTLIVYLETRRAITDTTVTRIANWLKVRYQLNNVYVFSKRV